jgi:hypothetical protein
VASDFPNFSEGGPPPTPQALAQRAAFRLLMSSEGQTLLAELSTQSLAEADELRVLTRFRAHHPPELVSAAFAQLRLRARARAKFSRADAMYFTAEGLEQASTERMASHHATLFDAVDTVFDLCSGIGGDLIGLARRHRVLAVDIDPVHSHMGVLNAGAYGIANHVQPLVADVEATGLYPETGGAFGVFIDPARRVDGRRLGAGESRPSLAWCYSLADATTHVAVKAWPALPLERVPRDWSVEFVSEGRELKEALLLAPGMGRPPRRATVLTPEASTLDPVAGGDIAIREPGRFLLDPDGAVTRAGLVEDLARSLGVADDVWKIDQEVAFLSSDAPMETPFGRALRVEASLPWNLNHLKAELRALDVGSVDIRKRGSAVDVDDIQRRLKLTGSRAATVVLTRVMNKPWAFVTFPTG